MDFAIGPQLQLAIAGSPSEDGFTELSSRFNSEYIPNLIIAGGEPGVDGQPTLMAERSMRDGLPTAYLCQGFTCQLPTTDAEELTRQIEIALTPTK